VSDLKEGEVERQFFLGGSAMRSQPRPQQRPEAFHSVDVDFAKPIAVVVASILLLPVIDREVFQEALPFFDIAERDPKQRSLARRYRMKSLKRLGRIDEARQLAAELLATASNNPDVLLEAGLLESEAGEFQIAIEHLQLADRLRPHSPAIAQALAIALRSANRVDEALPLFEFARIANEQLARAVTLVARVDRNPRNAEVRCEIGRIYLEYGLPEEGVTWLHGALNFDPNNRTAHALLADYYKARSTESATFAKFAIEHRRQAGP